MVSLRILLGVCEHGASVTLRLDRANRHGLIAGANGTGKIVSLQELAEAACWARFHAGAEAVRRVDPPHAPSVVAA